MENKKKCFFVPIKESDHETTNYYNYFFLLVNNGLIAGTYNGGDGTSGIPYQIANLTDLQELQNTSSDWNKYFIQTANIDASATSGWDGGNGFSPIGNTSTNFTGSYNGDGYTISGLIIDRSSTDYIGLFGRVSNATISNLGVVSVDIKGCTFTGGLVGYGVNTTISNCYCSGNVDNNNEYIGGGLIGETYTCTVTNSYNSASVNGHFYIGGLIGLNSNSSVSNCYNTGSVDGDNYAGGLIGCNDSLSTVTNCYSAGSVSASSYPAGLISYNCESTVTNCYSTGNVSASSIYHGGLIARNTGTVNNSFWDTQTSGESTSAGGTGKTTAEMKNLATFTDIDTPGLSTAWDFENNPYDDSADNDYWDFDNINGTINNGYPFLSWENGEETALPVELVSFIGNYEQNAVVFHWTTASEVNVIGFIIDRKTANEPDWKPIASYQTDNTLVCLKNQIGNAKYSFTDDTIIMGTSYCYLLKSIDSNGNMLILKMINIATTNVIAENVIQQPEQIQLLSAYPNPFNPQTTISYRLTKDSAVDINIYNVQGKLVRHLINNQKQSSAEHFVTWNAMDNNGKALSSGIYFVILKTGDQTKIMKIQLLR